MQITGMIFTTAALAVCAGANFWILFRIQARLAEQQKRNTKFLESQISILSEMKEVHEEEKQMHAKQMQSNAALMSRYGQVLAAYQRIRDWRQS